MLKRVILIIKFLLKLNKNFELIARRHPKLLTPVFAPRVLSACKGQSSVPMPFNIKSAAKVQSCLHVMFFVLEEVKLQPLL